MKQASLERTIVAIVDIESFTQSRPEAQAGMIRRFIEILGDLAEASPQLTVDAWSTGDGAILSVGRVNAIDDDIVHQFLDLVINMMACLIRQGIIVRTAINYSELDRVVAIPDPSPLRGGFVQVGDGINEAARIVAFSEPRELLAGESFLRLLRRLRIPRESEFVKNQTFRTKHGQMLQTYTYKPSGADADAFYSPDSPLHRYKRFSSFPPIKSKTLDYFVKAGLEFEIRKVIEQAYGAMESINETHAFLSSSAVLQVLIQMTYDPDDEVLVVSRNDQPGFWDQARRVDYIRYLRDSTNGCRYINQRRLLVYRGGDGNPSQTAFACDLASEDEAALIQDLRPLHAPGTFSSFPSTYLFTYQAISSLRYGFTLSKRMGLAIIPVPAPDEAELGTLSPREIAAFMDRYPQYDPLSGPMKAVITADPGYIDDLIREFDGIWKSPHSARLN